MSSTVERSDMPDRPVHPPVRPVTAPVPPEVVETVARATPTAVGALCRRSFRSGSGRYYDCSRTTGHGGSHALCDPAPASERDAVDAEAARLWAERHDDHNGPFWQASCPACTATAAEAFRLGYRAALASPAPAPQGEEGQR